MFKNIANRREAPPNLALEILVNDKGRSIAHCSFKDGVAIERCFCFRFCFPSYEGSSSYLQIAHICLISRCSKNSCKGSFLVHWEGTTPRAFSIVPSNDLQCGTKILQQLNFANRRIFVFCGKQFLRLWKAVFWSCFLSFLQCWVLIFAIITKEVEFASIMTFCFVLFFFYWKLLAIDKWNNMKRCKTRYSESLHYNYIWLIGPRATVPLDVYPLRFVSKRKRRFN